MRSKSDKSAPSGDTWCYDVEFGEDKESFDNPNTGLAPTLVVLGGVVKGFVWN